MTAQTQRQRDYASLLDPDVMREPYEVLRSLREDIPVYWSEDLSGWVLTRYDDVSDAFRDPRYSAGNLENQVRKQLRGHDIAIAKDFLRVRNKMMLHNDGNEHLRLRKPGNKTFARPNIKAFEPMLEQVTRDTFDALPSTERLDFATEIAEPLSTRVIAEIFDVPHEDRVQFQAWSDDVSRFFGESMGDVAEDARIANDGILALEEYFLALATRREQNPGHDLLSLFLQYRDALTLSKEEVIAQCVLVMMAGHFSTIDQLCNAVWTLMTHRNAWVELVNEPAIVETAVEECMRWDGGVIFMARTLSDDVEVRGTTMRAGDPVFLGMGAANRDPAAFERPDQLDLRRSPNKHLGFGFGPHLCIGAALARMEMKVLLIELARRFPNLHLDPERPARRKCETLFFRGFYTIPVAT